MQTTWLSKEQQCLQAVTRWSYLQYLSHHNYSKLLLHLLLRTWALWSTVPMNQHGRHVKCAGTLPPYGWPQWTLIKLLLLMHFHFRINANYLTTFNKGWVWIFANERPVLLGWSCLQISVSPPGPAMHFYYKVFCPISCTCPSPSPVLDRTAEILYIGVTNLSVHV